MARSPAIVYMIIWLIVKNVLCSRGSNSIGEKEKWRMAGANEHPGINGMPYVYFYIYHNALQETPNTFNIQPYQRDQLCSPSFKTTKDTNFRQKPQSTKKAEDRETRS